MRAEANTYLRGSGGTSQIWRARCADLLAGLLLPMTVVAALLAGILVGILGVRVVVAVIAVMAIALVAALMATRRDEVVASLIILVAILIDYYPLLGNLSRYFPFGASVLALILLSIIFLGRSKKRPGIVPSDLPLWGLLLVLSAPAIFASISLSEGANYYARVMVNALLMYLVGTQIARDIAHLRRFLSGIAAVGTLIAIHTIIYAKAGVFLLATGALDTYLAHTNDFTLSGSQTTRVGSFLLNPDSNGAFLGLMFVIALGLLLESSSALMRSVYLVEIALLLAALLFTYSIAAGIAVGGGVIVLLILAGRPRALVYLSVLGLAGLATALMVFPAEIGLLLQHASTPQEVSLRTAAWQTALRVIVSHPWTGIGLGITRNYDARALPYSVPEHYGQRIYSFSHPHESYLELAALAGLPVLLVFLTLVGRALWIAVRNCRMADGAHRPLLAGAIAGIATVSLNSLAINAWTLFPLVVVDWLILGAIASPVLAQSLASRARLAAAVPRVAPPGVARTPISTGMLWFGAMGGPLKSGILYQMRQLARQVWHHTTVWRSRTMNRPTQRKSRWRAVPCIGLLAWEWQISRDELREPCLALTGPLQGGSDLPPYPIDMSSKLALPFATLDEDGIPRHSPDAYPAPYHPTTIAQYALAHWNAYLATGSDQHRHGFTTQAHWLVTHYSRIAEEAIGWPLPCPLPDWYAPGPTLSALTQGESISVLVRAYRLTGDDVFLQAARRAVRAFELDILDGGVSVPIGEDGIFFEEVAVYPAGHILNGFILALFGLYDYVALTGDAQTTALIARSLVAFHGLIDEFDTGYWSRYDLLHRGLARRSYHALHVTLLQALAELSGCERCAAVAARWAGYQRSLGCRLRYYVASRSARYRRWLWRRVRRMLFASPGAAKPIQPNCVSVPITAFPVAGGMRGVLAGIAHAMAGEWEMEYLTSHLGHNTQGLTIHTFGGAIANHWQFPNVWLYVFAGWRKLLSLLRQSYPYRLILPQDGVSTGAFSAIAGKMAGLRVVCMDHGNVTLPYSRAYREERMRLLSAMPWYLQAPTRIRFALHDLSLQLLTTIATRYADCFLPAGDDVAETYTQRLGVHPSRIVRFPFMIDVASYTPLPGAAKKRLRAQNGIAEDAVLITMVNRLAIEKGLDVAVQGLSQALAALPPEIRRRVRVIIAGDGPQRSQLEADIRRHELGSVCKLWGEATADEVAMLLGLSDIFLYTSTRGINPVSILEAMAAGCVVVASTEPKLVANYLADGRGIPILAGDARAVATALAQAIHDLPQSREMGLLARKYVVAHHGATALQRSLRRATYFAPSIMPGGRQDAVVTTPEIAGQDARGSMRNRSANAVNGRSTV